MYQAPIWVTSIEVQPMIPSPVEKGWGEQLKNVWIPLWLYCSRTLESVLRAYYLFGEKETLLVANMVKGSLLWNCISYGSARRRGKKSTWNFTCCKYKTVTLRGRREHRGLPLLSLTKLVVFKIRGFCPTIGLTFGNPGNRFYWKVRLKQIIWQA